MRPFYIIKNKYGFYSVSFVNQTTGKRTAWKSTHTSDYSEAMLIASTWYKDGSPSEQARTALRNSKQENKSSGIDFVNSFVTSGLLRSLNIFRISVHKKSIGDCHCKEMRGMVDRYWLPYFDEEFTVGELTEQSNCLLLSGLVETPRSING